MDLILEDLSVIKIQNAHIGYLSDIQIKNQLYEVDVGLDFLMIYNINNEVLHFRINKSIIIIIIASENNIIEFYGNNEQLSKIQIIDLEMKNHIQNSNIMISPGRFRQLNFADACWRFFQENKFILIKF